MILNLDFLRFQYFKKSQDLQLVVGMIIVNPTPVSIIELHVICFVVFLSFPLLRSCTTFT